MNYLTNHYRHKAQVLAEKVALLENRLSQMQRASAYGDAGSAAPTSPFGYPESAGPGAPTSPFGNPESAGPGAPTSPFGVAGNAGGPGGGLPTTFSGLVLGQLLAAGNMNAVYQYLSQFYGNDITSMNAILSSYGYSVPSSAGGQGGAGQAFSGAQLGQLLGQGNMNTVNQYLGQFGGQYPTQSGPASVSGRMNAPRSARRGGARPATGR
jgi:hypothetical protein